MPQEWSNLRRHWSRQPKENQVARKGGQSGSVKSVKIDEVDARAVAAKEANVSTGTMSAYKPGQLHRYL